MSVAGEEGQVLGTNYAEGLNLSMATSMNTAAAFVQQDTNPKPRDRSLAHALRVLKVDKGKDKLQEEVRSSFAQELEHRDDPNPATVFQGDGDEVSAVSTEEESVAFCQEGFGTTGLWRQQQQHCDSGYLLGD